MSALGGEIAAGDVLRRARPARAMRERIGRHAARVTAATVALSAVGSVVAVPAEYGAERALITIAAAAAVLGIAASLRRARGRVAAVRGWILVGAALWCALHATVNLALAGMELPFASELALVGIVGAAAGAYSADLRGRMPGREQAAVALDAAVVTAASTAALVALLSRGGTAVSSDGLTYAAVFVGIVSAVLILNLAVFAAPRFRGAYPLLGGLALIGLGYGATGSAGSAALVGNPAALLVAAGSVYAAYGAATWTDTASTAPKFRRIARMLRNVLPVASLGMAILVGVAADAWHESGGAVALGLTMLAMALLVVRQTVLLAERDAATRRLVAAQGEAERRSRQVAGVHSVSRRLSERGPTQSTLESIVDIVSDTFGYGRVALYISEGDRLRLGAQRGYSALSPLLSASRGVVGRVVRTLQPALVRDVSTDPDYVAADAAVSSEVCAPMVADGEILGILNIESTADQALDDGDLEAVVAIADSLAFALALAIRAERLTREKDFTNAVLDSLGAAVVVTDASGEVVRFNKACSEISGYSIEELGQPGVFRELVPPDERARVQEVVGSVHTVGAPKLLENSWRDKSGATRTLAWTNRPVLNPDGSVDYVIASGIDVTERKRLEEQLADQALRDALTGLANRALLLDRIDHALTRRHARGGVAVLFVDLDRFKSINDTLGHHAGDEALQEAARRIVVELRAGDTAARLGGDEFAVLLEDVADAESAVEVADRVRRAIGATPLSADRKVLLSASIGVAVATGKAAADVLLRRADIAMYVAKNAGGDRVRLFRPEMQRSLLGRTELEMALREPAVVDQLRLLYQPVTDLVRGTTVGAEALLRWRHPRHGLLAPGDFVHLAEKSAAIITVGRWVMVEACRQLAAWSNSGSETLQWLSVNVSPRQLEDATFCDFVRETLSNHSLTPTRLVVEVTEEMLVGASSTAARNIERLARLGVRIAVDDFGTGYSSLGYLRTLPVHFMKLDRSFVADVDTDPRQSAVVGALAALGRRLGVRVLAEGIETEQQLSTVAALGCELGQGYHIQPPAPPSSRYWRRLARQARTEAPAQAALRGGRAATQGRRRSCSDSPAA